MDNTTSLPLVYACSGCSNVAQLANNIALQLDASGTAQMSCISGVGGNVKPLVKLARSGRAILALDGCALACTHACLAQAGVTADVHLVLTELGARKRYHTHCSAEESEDIRAQVESVALTLQHSAKATA